MVHFLAGVAWQIAIFWAATQIGYSMQVVDKATVLIGEPAVCAFFQKTAENGRCRVTGRLEATLRNTWTLEPDPGLPLKVELTDRSIGMIYDPKDWHMSGGAPAVIGLGALWLALVGAGIWLSYLVTRRRVRKAAMNSASSCT